MRRQRALLIGVLTVLLLPGLLGCVRSDKPITGPIMRQGDLAGKRVSLTPEPFKIGTPRSEVLARLDHSGFEPFPVGTQGWPANTFGADVASDAEIYKRDVNNFVCNLGLYAVVEFDEQDRLTTAQGAQFEHGCL